MEIVTRVTRQGSHFTFFSEFHQADNAVLVRGEVLWVILTLHNRVYDSIALLLSVVLLCKARSDSFVNARSTADQEAASASHEHCWSNGIYEEQNPVQVIEQVVACTAVSGV